MRCHTLSGGGRISAVWVPARVVILTSYVSSGKYNGMPSPLTTPSVLQPSSPSQGMSLSDT